MCHMLMPTTEGTFSDIADQMTLPGDISFYQCLLGAGTKAHCVKQPWVQRWRGPCRLGTMNRTNPKEWLPFLNGPYVKSDAKLPT